MKNHFATFSLPVSFALNIDELEAKYLEFQRQFHPDNSSTADIEKSIAVNDAYQILKNNLSRAAHILQLNGIDIEDDEKAPKVDQTTLIEVLELREKIFEANQDEIKIYKENLNIKIKSLLKEMAFELENKDFSKAAQILIRAKYFEKTVKDLKNK